MTPPLTFWEHIKSALGFHKMTTGECSLCKRTDDVLDFGEGTLICGPCWRDWA